MKGGADTKKLQQFSRCCVILLLLASLISISAFAITESEVEAEVAAVGREAVTGNVLIWFLCAVAFLKVSQKIDSFMSGLGVNVGHTGGSMLAEVMIAAKTVSTVASGAGRVLGFGGGGRSSSGAPGATGSKGADGATGFLRGGLAGMASRKITNDAVRSATSARHTTATHATTHTSTTSTAATTATAAYSERTLQVEQATHAASVMQHEQISSVDTRSSAEHVSSQVTSADASTATSAATATHTQTNTTSQSTAQHTGGQTSMPAASSPDQPLRHASIGAAVFASSLQKGGTFANRVIGRVAKGEIRTTGSITGDMAAQSLMSYMGYTALGEQSAEKISYREVEIGGGRITGVEVTPEYPEGIAFGMYHAEQYTKPEGSFTQVYSADGAQWYKQYAVDAVSKTPYKAPDGEVAYRSEIIKKLPQPPKRKDRI